MYSAVSSPSPSAAPNLVEFARQVLIQIELHLAAVQRVTDRGAYGHLNRDLLGTSLTCFHAILTTGGGVPPWIGTVTKAPLMVLAAAAVVLSTSPASKLMGLASRKAPPSALAMSRCLPPRAAVWYRAETGFELELDPWQLIGHGGLAVLTGHAELADITLGVIDAVGEANQVLINRGVNQFFVGHGLLFLSDPTRPYPRRAPS